MYSLKLLQFSLLESSAKRGYRKNGRLYSILVYSREWTCTECPRSIINIRFWNLKTRNYSLFSFQWNFSHFVWILYEEVMTVLPGTPVYWLASGLVKNPIFHGVYLHNCNEWRDETFTTCTLTCIINTITIFPSESFYKKLYSENGKMTWK